MINALNLSEICVHVNVLWIWKFVKREDPFFEGITFFMI